MGRLRWGQQHGSLKVGPLGETASNSNRLIMRCVLFLLVTLVVLLTPGQALPWIQSDGLADCAPGKCPKTAEISPIVCSDTDPTFFFQNGYPLACIEGEECDPEVADSGAGNPCRPAEGGDGYSK